MFPSLPNEIFNALDLGQAGDAILFAKIFRNTYRYDCSVHSWYVYDSAIHSWRKDVTRETLDAMTSSDHYPRAIVAVSPWGEKL